jgi:hypothetical protein
MQIALSDDSTPEYENEKEELLQYKLEEVKSDWVNDFGEIPKELLKEINDKITNPNLKRIQVLEEAVRTLRRELNSKNLEFITWEIRKYKSSTVDFSDITIVVKKSEKQLEKPLDINQLNAMYKDVLQPLKYKLVSKMRIAKIKKIDKIIAIVCAIIIATVFYILGKYT